MSNSPKLSRRQLLAATGLGGASLFLPSLAGRASAQTTPPKRLVIMFSLHGTVYENWRMRRPGLTESDDWELPLDDPDPASFSEILRPLHGVRSQLLVLDGIAQTTAIADVLFNNHPKGRIHSLSASAISRLNGQQATATAPSIDQIVAQAVRRPDRISSLELMGTGDEPMIFSAPGVSLPFDGVPSAVFDRLFPGNQTTQPMTNADRVRSAQASVLDLVRGEFDHTKTRLDAADKVKLDLHRDLVRDLEMRLGQLSQVTCERPDRPQRGQLPYDQRFNAFVQLAAAALACDLTRVVSIGLPLQSNAMVGAPPGDVHNDFAHHVGENPTATNAMTAYHRNHAQHFRTLIDALAAIPENGGTMLDNTLVMWANEFSIGQHKFNRWPIVLAGSAGGAFRTGRYLRWASRTPTPDPNPNWAGMEQTVGPPHNRLLVSIARAFGINTNQIGQASVRTVAGVNIDLTGPLDRLV